MARPETKWLTFEEYSNERIIAQGESRSQDEQMVCGVLGMCGEAGEAAEIMKKHFFHGKEFDRERFIKELGDVLWYINYTANAIGSSLEEVARVNNEKLRERYPNGWNVEAAKKLPLREEG